MTDAHCHFRRGESRHFLCEPFDGEPSEGDEVFYGTHPWDFESFDADRLRRRLQASPRSGVGEIGLDRLRQREIPPGMREVFAAQLAIAGEQGRPVVLHGAKCWGEVVKTIIANAAARGIPSFLFHGFSRADGLLEDIIALNGFISLGPALCNDHAHNYHELARRIPLERIVLESDATAHSAGTAPSIEQLAIRLAELRGLSLSLTASAVERNCERFLSGEQP